MVDEDNMKKLRFKQASMLKNSQGSVSFSRVVNEIIRKGLK